MHISSTQLAQSLALSRTSSRPGTSSQQTAASIEESPVTERYLSAVDSSPPDPHKLAGLRFDMLA